MFDRKVLLMFAVSREGLGSASLLDFQATEKGARRQRLAVTEGRQCFVERETASCCRVDYLRGKLGGVFVDALFGLSSGAVDNEKGPHGQGLRGSDRGGRSPADGLDVTTQRRNSAAITSMSRWNL